MKKNVFTTPVILFLFTFSSCLKENVELNFPREEYLGDNLRIDGFYYQKKSDGTMNNLLHFFYKNGVIFEIIISKDIAVLSECIAELTNELVESQRKRKYHWGIFIIKNNDFYSEQWATPIDGNYVHLITQTGEILSDTCFMITKFDNGINIYDVHGMWYFYPYSPKPDSTNTFIK